MPFKKYWFLHDKVNMISTFLFFLCNKDKKISNIHEDKHHLKEHLPDQSNAMDRKEIQKNNYN